MDKRQKPTLGKMDSITSQRVDFFGFPPGTTFISSGLSAPKPNKGRLGRSTKRCERNVC